MQAPSLGLCSTCWLIVVPQCVCWQLLAHFTPATSLYSKWSWLLTLAVIGCTSILPMSWERLPTRTLERRRIPYFASTTRHALSSSSCAPAMNSSTLCSTSSTLPMDGHVSNLFQNLISSINLIHLFFFLVLGMSLIKALVVLLFPVAVLKVVLAVMQGGSAWRNLGYIDIKEREEAVAEKKQ